MGVTCHWGSMPLGRLGVAWNWDSMGRHGWHCIVAAWGGIALGRHTIGKTWGSIPLGRHGAAYHWDGIGRHCIVAAWGMCVATRECHPSPLARASHPSLLARASHSSPPLGHTMSCCPMPPQVNPILVCPKGIPSHAAQCRHLHWQHNILVKIPQIRNSQGQVTLAEFQNPAIPNCLTYPGGTMS